MEPTSKIFAIGHFKTGTTSFHTAATMLGMEDLHFPRKYVESLNNGGDVHWDLRPWDSMSNVNEVEYPRCDEVYPGSKFVLTTRGLDSWLESMRKHMATPWPPRIRALIDGRMKKIFDCECRVAQFDPEHLTKVFKEHEEQVRDYFSGKKSEQLLVLALESEHKMERLSEFLGKSLPYPKRNITRQHRQGRMVGRKGQPMILGPGGLHPTDYKKTG
jgi:hypothetical protein